MRNKIIVLLISLKLLFGQPTIKEYNDMQIPYVRTYKEIFGEEWKEIS